MIFRPNHLLNSFESDVRKLEMAYWHGYRMTKEKMVKIHLFKDNKNYNGDVFVGVNGRTFQIQRGVDVEVPECVAEVLRNSETQNAEAVRLTSETSRSLAGYLWADNERLVFAKDTGGDENYQLFGVRLDGEDLRAYTPFPGVRATIIDDLQTLNDIRARIETQLGDLGAL